MNLDWERTINAIVPLSSEERLADAIRAGDQYREVVSPTGTRWRYPSFYGGVPIVDSYPKPQPKPHPVPAHVQPLAWWRRALLRLIGGTP